MLSACLLPPSPRYSRAEHVRVFAAQAVGYLFRSCPQSALRGAVRALLFEHALIPSTERTHGAGTLLAEAVVGVSHGLHSRAAAVLGLMLQQDLLQPEDFRRAAGQADAVAEGGTAAVHEEGGGHAGEQGRAAGCCSSLSSLNKCVTASWWWWW